MALTVATMTTSSRSIRLEVARSRRRSMSSLIEASFSMYDVGRRDVRLGLVVVVVRDEVLDGVRGAETAAARRRAGRPASCCGERTSVGLAVVGDDVRQRHRLARPGDAEQRLVPVAPLEPRRQLGDGLGLVAGGLEGGDDLETRWLGIGEI